MKGLYQTSVAAACLIAYTDALSLNADAVSLTALNEALKPDQYYYVKKRCNNGQLKKKNLCDTCNSDP